MRFSLYRFEFSLLYIVSKFCFYPASMVSEQVYYLLVNVENKLLIKLSESIVYVVCEKRNCSLQFDIGFSIKFLKRIALETLRR